MKKFISLISVVLVLAICMIPVASASVNSSAYFYDYYSEVQSRGNGKVAITIDVTGKPGVNGVGATKIILEESPDDSSWSTVKTFRSANYPSMIANGTRVIFSDVTYDGISGYYYRATVTFYAGTDGVGDTVTCLTATHQAS